jgi:hypothetical protein
LLLGLVAGLEQTGGPGLAAFGAFLVVLTAAIVAFVLWLELAVRSAAIAAASLFLPLALVGLAWPATSHWARRLGETLAALVLSKLVIASVLALAAGLLGSSSGVSGVVEGVALLAIAAFAPFALLKLVPAVEAGAVAHLEGLGQRPVRAGQRLGAEIAGMEIGGAGGLGGLAGLGSKNAGSQGAGGSNLRTVDHLGSGPFTADRPVTADGIPAGSGPAGSGPAGSGPAGSGPAGSGPAGSGPAGSGPAAPSASVGSVDSSASANLVGSADRAAPSASVGTARPGDEASDLSHGAAVARWTVLLSQGDQPHG